MLHIGGGGGGRKTKGPTADSTEFKNPVLVRYVLRNITAFTATSTFRRWKYKYTTTNKLQLRSVAITTCRAIEKLVAQKQDMSRCILKPFSFFHDYS